MKYYLLPLTIILVSLMALNCSSKVDNSLTIRNMASGAVYINFRGEMVTVPSGKTTIIKEIPKGRYNYNTTFSVPAGASSSSAEGDVNGEVKIDAGTKILLLFSSTLNGEAYTLFATISSSDDLDDTGTSP